MTSSSGKSEIKSIQSEEVYYINSITNYNQSNNYNDLNYRTTKVNSHLY